MPKSTVTKQTSIAALAKSIPVGNNDLLKQALTHRSWLNEHPQGQATSNERLEFLGDAVLELVVTQFLFEKFPEKPEGELTSLRASLVRTETLARIANSLYVGLALKLSHGEELGGGRQNEGLLANTFEAIIGAIYLSRGVTTVKRFVARHLFPELEKILSHRLYRDAKSGLQELVQAKGLPAPIYRVLKEEGPDHNKTFTIAVFVGDKRVCLGTGKSKQEAQQEAAATALETYEPQ